VEVVPVIRVAWYVNVGTVLLIVGLAIAVAYWLGSKR